MKDAYQVMLKDRFYRCDTCLQEAFFTLDNAKYWYLVFIYDFHFKSHRYLKSKFEISKSSRIRRGV